MDWKANVGVWVGDRLWALYMNIFRPRLISASSVCLTLFSWCAMIPAKYIEAIVKGDYNDLTMASKDSSIVHVLWTTSPHVGSTMDEYLGNIM